MSLIFVERSLNLFQFEHVFKFLRKNWRKVKKNSFSSISRQLLYSNLDINANELDICCWYAACVVGWWTGRRGTTGSLTSPGPGERFSLVRIGYTSWSQKGRGTKMKIYLVFEFLFRIGTDRSWIIQKIPIMWRKRIFKCR